MRFFQWFRPPSAPDEIYSSSLETLHLGRALWYPEPHATGEPQIGDVGYIREGAFIRLFNVDTSAPEKKVTFWPISFEDIEPLPPHVLQIDPRRRPLAPDHYCSHGVEATRVHASVDLTAGAGVSTTLGASYTCKATQGAVLVLKSEAHAETIFENRVLESYIIRNHDKWYAYARDVLGHRVKQENLVMVSGWVKTEADWAAAAFSNTSTSSGISVEGHVGGIAGLGAGGSHTSSVTGPKMHRHGEHYAADTSATRPADTKRDQCVFLKRCKVLRLLWLPRKVIAGAGYHRSPDSGDTRGASGEEGVVTQEVDDLEVEGAQEWEGEGEVPDPLDILLAYILETTGVETAIACDEDVESVAGGNRVVDFASYLRRVQPPVEVDGTVGFLCMEHTISRERDRAFAPRAITSFDLADWSNLTFEGAGCLSDRGVLIGPTETGARHLKTKQLTFSDLRKPSNGCNCFSLSADGKLLAASFVSTDILVWRLSDGLLVQRLHQGHTDTVCSLSFSPKDYIVVSGSDDKSAIVWDVRSGHGRLRLEGHGGQVNAVVYAPHGELIATGSRDDNPVKIWDASTGACLHSFSLDVHIYYFAFSPDSSRLFVELNNSCIIYNMQTYTRIATLEHDATKMLDWSMSPQGDRIITGSEELGQVNIWSAVTGEQLLTIQHPEKLAFPVAFSPDGSEVLAACDADKTAVTYDSRTGQLRRAFKLSDTLYDVSYSQNGDYVALGTINGDFQVHDAKLGTFLATFKGSGEGEEVEETQFPSDSRALLARFSRGPLVLYNIQDTLRMR